MLYRLIFSYSVDRSIPRMAAAFLMLTPLFCWRFFDDSIANDLISL